jgi:hypothetical protein
LDLEARSPFPGRSLARFWHDSASRSDAGRLSNDSAIAEVVENGPLAPDSEQSLQKRRVWASLAMGGWTYIRREAEARGELFHLREDAQELHDLAGDPAAQPQLEQMRRALQEMTAGPLTRERFNP